MAGPGHRHRRRALLIAALPIHGAWPVAALAMESAGGRTLLLGISSELGLLQPAVLQLAQRIRSAIDPADMAATLRAAAQRVHTVIGPAICTARSTMPSLIDDDFAAGRTLPIHGVVFSHTELVLLLAVAGIPEPATGG